MKYLWDCVLTRNDGTQISIHPLWNAAQVESRMVDPNKRDNEILDEEITNMFPIGVKGGTSDPGTSESFKEKYVRCGILRFDTLKWELCDKAKNAAFAEQAVAKAKTPTPKAFPGTHNCRVCRL